MALNNILDKQAQQQMAELYSKNSNPSSAEIGNIVRSAAERNSKSVEEQTSANKQLLNSTNNLAKTQGNLSNTMKDAESALVKNVDSITGIAQSFQTFTSPLEKFKDSLSNIGKSISSGFKTPGRTAMKALNIGGIFNRAIAKSEFIEQQKAIDPNATPDFEAANKKAKEIKANEKAIADFQKKTNLNEKQMAQTAMGSSLLGNREKLAGEFKQLDLTANTEEELEAIKADKDEQKIESEQVKKSDENLKETKETNKLLVDIRDSLDSGSGSGGLFSSIMGGIGSMFAGKAMAGAVGGGGATAAGGGLLAKGGAYLSSVGGAGALAKGLGIGGLATYAGSKIQDGGEYLKEKGYEKTGKTVGTAGTAVKYAGIGAMVGSVIPGVGTAIGAGVGGLIGAGKGVYDNFFSEDSSKELEPELTEEQKNTGGKTFSEFELAKADKDLYDEYSTRKDEIFKKERAKLLSKHKNPSARTELIATRQASNIAQRQAQDEFTMRAQKVGAAEVHGDTDYYKRKEESYNTSKENESMLSKMVMSKNSELKMLGKEGMSDEEFVELEEIANSGKGEEWLANHNKKLEKMQKGRAKFANILPSDTDSFSPGFRTEGQAIDQASSDVETAKMNAQKPSANVVNAPSTTNISNQSNNNIIKSNPKNNEGSVNKYLTSLWTL